MNFGKKCPKRGERGGRRQSKKCHCKFTPTYEFSGKKRNVISKKGQGGSRPFGNFPKKNIHIWGDGRPLAAYAGQTMQPTDCFRFFLSLEYVGLLRKNLKTDNCLVKFGCVSGRSKM